MQKKTTLFEASILVIGIIVGACILAGLISTYFFKNDNQIEEIAEEIIKQETGIDIDLSPSTPENTMQVFDFDYQYNEFASQPIYGS